MWLPHRLPKWGGHAESATDQRGRITKQSRDIANNILWANEHVFTIDGAGTCGEYGIFPSSGKS